MSFYLRAGVAVGPFRVALTPAGVIASPAWARVLTRTGLRVGYARVDDGGAQHWVAVRNGHGPAQPSWPGPVAHAAHTSPGDRPLALAPARSTTLLDRLARADRTRLAWPWVLAATLVAAVLVSPALLLVGAPVIAVVAVTDRVRRTVVLLYDVDGGAAARFAALVQRFAVVTAVERAWHAGPPRTPLRRGVDGPARLVSNIAIPTLDSTGRALFLLPDRVLVRDGHTWSEHGYDEVRVTAEPERVVEDDPVPGDAAVTDGTWSFVDRDGAPTGTDREGPVVTYGRATATTAGGLRTVVSFSRVAAAHALADAVADMRGPAPAPGTIPVQRTARAPRVHIPDPRHPGHRAN